MNDKTLANRIATLMISYADYSRAVRACMDEKYGSEAYEEARETRGCYGRWIREELDALKALGIDMSRFDYINGE